jgi:hypothetical protein
VVLLWIVGGALGAICLVVIARAWIAGVFGQRRVASRYSAWVAIVRQVPPGSRLTGAEPDSWTMVDIGQVAQNSQESRGER